MNHSALGGAMMDSASKVKIEYTDPSDIFSAFNDEFLPRLPLEELHWSSSSRPVRTIKSLHVDLVSDSSSVSNADSGSRGGSADNAGASNTEISKKERRHQIPGLRRTPYLKVYLVSCNDVEAYKGTFRKDLRDWVKNNSPSPRSSAAVNKQDNHDAFEWLIIHVIPASSDDSSNTSRPPSVQGDGVAEKRPTSSRWPSRSSASVFERLRSEFNGTSKTSVDRVVQIQLRKQASIDNDTRIDQRADDSKTGWAELIFKLKSLILASFDLRVSQYEEDIKEREGQKKVFGWNFNTFFVLKEGLAMGFESMGLLEDALSVYHELDFGLKTSIEEQQSEAGEQQIAHFTEYTEDLYESFKQVETAMMYNKTETASPKTRISDLGFSLLNTARKPFRELILSNKISLLDFQSYVFARQTNLSLRLANKSNSQKRREGPSASQIGLSIESNHSDDDADLSKPSDYEPQSLILLADVVKASIEFLTYATRAIRNDLVCAFEKLGTGQHEGEKPTDSEKVLENFVMSWIFSASRLILEVTTARSLTAQLNPLLRQITPDSSHLDVNADSDDTTADAKEVQLQNLPARTSSLHASKSAKRLSLRNDQELSISSLDASRLLPPGNPHPGSQDLAGQRGDLLALSKRVLNNLSTRERSHQNDAAETLPAADNQEGTMHNIESDETSARKDDTPRMKSPSVPDNPAAGLCNADLRSAMMSNNEFQRLYESVTKSALVHYVVGNRSKAAEAMTADLAMARFEAKDYNTAAAYFRRLAPFYANTVWPNLEISMLNSYAQCLRYLDQKEVYVRVSLKIVAKMIRERQSSRRQKTKSYNEVQDLHVDTKSSVEQLSTILVTSKSLLTEISVPLLSYFSDVDLSQHIEHFAEQDGFQMNLSLRSLLSEPLSVDSVRVRIVSIADEQRAELWLSAQDVIIQPGLANLAVSSSVLQPGWFILDKILIESSNIRFILDLAAPTSTVLVPRSRNSASLTISGAPVQRKRFLIWPRIGNFDISVKQNGAIDLAQSSSIRVELSTGQNEVIKCQLSLRAASAGLRLHTAEAYSSSSVITIRKTQPGSIEVNNIATDSKVNVVIPYSVETDLQEISVRTLVDYTTPTGDFSIVSNSNVPIMLPLAINVQDLFKRTMLVSKFTIGPSSQMPVRISKCHLECSPGLRVVMPAWTEDLLDVFVSQPLSLVAKVYPNLKDDKGGEPDRRRLWLVIDYRCLDTIIYSSVQEQFISVLQASPFQRFRNLLYPTLLDGLRARVRAQDVEAITLAGEMMVGGFEDWAWSSLLASLPLKDGEGLSVWLRNWHEENPKIRLVDSGGMSPMQHLTVPVDIPEMQVVHTARLKRIKKPSASSQIDTVPIGEGVAMELTLTHTRIWSDGEKQGQGTQALDFCFEIPANPEMWIIGGQKRVHFSAQEGETKRFALLLWPQKTGHLTVPSVEIHSLRAAQTTDDRRAIAEAAISCELDFQNAGETILVIPDLTSTTVSLDPSGSGRGWLVESRGRTSS